jgi:hypothetical protein
MEGNDSRPFLNNVVADKIQTVHKKNKIMKYKEENKFGLICT